MNKLLEFGRKFMFYARVLSGYEERRIKTYRLQLHQRIREAQERKVSLRKLPEQTILAEVRRMVEEMQTLNKKLEETEAAIEDYFKPLDNEAQMMMDVQLKGEEKNMKEMVKLMQEQALLEKAEHEKMASEKVAKVMQQALLEKTAQEKMGSEATLEEADACVSSKDNKAASNNG